MSRTLDKSQGILNKMPEVDSAPIVESGSNADGAWTRFADGTQICRGSRQVYAPTFISNKAFPYYTNTYSNQGPHTLPIAFVNTTYNIMATDTGGSVLPAAAPRGLSEFEMTLVVSPQSIAAPGVSCAWTAVGYWK